MIIPSREASDRRLKAPAGSSATGGDAAVSDEAANRLNPDEWEFLRATPDFDAEEMSSVTLSGPGDYAPGGWDAGPSARLRPVEPFDAPSGDFPEVGNLAEMLGDLIEKRGGPGAGPGAADAWANVPAAAEWASLMAPHESPERAAQRPGEPPPAPGARDVLLDALAAGERIGLLPESGQN